MTTSKAPEELREAAARAAYESEYEGARWEALILSEKASYRVLADAALAAIEAKYGPECWANLEAAKTATFPFTAGSQPANYIRELPPEEGGGPWLKERK